MALIIHNEGSKKKKFKHEIEANIHNNIELLKIISKFYGFAKVIDEFQETETAKKYILKEIKRLSGGNVILSESELNELKTIFSNQLDATNKAYLELGLDKIPIAEYEKRNKFEKKFNTSLKISYSIHKSILELLNKYNFKENIISYLERQLFISEHENSERSLTKIDKNFIDKIRLNFYGITTHIFGNEDKNFKIVPKEFTHEYLKGNFIIDKNILNYYYAPCVELISDEEYQKEVKRGFIGKKERMLLPYPYIYFGAYFNRKSLHTKLISLQYDKNLLLNGKEVKYFEDLIPYFKEYAKGFEKGYNEFEKECIKKYLNEYSDKRDYTNKIFEFVTKKTLFGYSEWLNSGNSSFTISENSKNNIKIIIGASEHGQKQGYFYKAWSIIFSNNDLYKPYFDKLKTSSIEPAPPLKEKQKSEHIETKKILLDDILEMQNNLIPKISIKDVYNHFKQLTEITNKFDKFILTNEQLLIFIKSTFIDKEPIKQEWNSKPQTKKSIRKIFYEFYYNSMKAENNFKNLKSKYFDIMDKAFFGFNKTDYNDFHKT